MRDLINIIDKSVLFEAHNRKANRIGLKKELKDLFSSLGPSYEAGPGVQIRRSLRSNNHLNYEILITTYYYENFSTGKQILEKLKKAEGKYFERGLSAKIQKIIKKYIPDWISLGYESHFNGIIITGYVDMSEHVPL